MRFVYETDLPSWPHHFPAKPGPVLSEDVIADVLAWTLQNFGQPYGQGHENAECG